MKFWLILFFSCFLGACATVGGRQNCDVRGLESVSYFASEQKLVAFHFQAAAKGQVLEGILQVKKMGEQIYEVTALSVVGGYRLLTAQVTSEDTHFTYIVPMADYAVVRGKLEMFLKMLLFAPQAQGKCRQEKGLQTVIVPQGQYQYEAGAIYPQSFTRKKTLGSVRLSYGQYTSYEKGSLPHYLFYQDGAIEAELVLISVKK